MTVRELINSISEKLNSLDESERKAKIIVDFITDSALPFKEATPEQSEDAVELAEELLDGTPLQYVLGEWEFYGRIFKVGKGVLIPRQDTELLVDIALEFLKGKHRSQVIDLCSGSGCVAISVERQSDSDVEALEKYDEAFFYLKENIRINHSKVVAIKQDVSEVRDKKYDLIVSNPPYITADEMKALSTEVKKEPETALFGGADGLDFYRLITESWTKTLKNGAMLAVEIGAGQGESVKELFIKAGLKNTIIHKDLNSLDRVVTGFMEE